MAERTNIEILKELNIAFKNESREKVEENIELVIKTILNYNPYSVGDNLSNLFSIFSNYIKMLIDEKKVNPNFVLSSVIKYTKNYIGLFFIGMLVRHGANPNVYYPYPGYGNLHILAITAIRSGGTVDPNFRNICNLLRELGSDINYQAYSYGDSENRDLDLNFVEKVAEDTYGEQNLRNNMTVKEFIAQSGNFVDEDIKFYVNSLGNEDLLNFIIAADKSSILMKVVDTNFFTNFIKNSKINTTKFFINISIASANNLAEKLTEKQIPLITELINGQPIPIFAAVSSMDSQFFSIYIKRGALIKYLTINYLIVYYKYYKQEEIMLYKNSFDMLLEAITIGADIDLYQFDLLSTTADYGELDDIRVAFQEPKWKKLCGVVQKKPRQEIIQMAFELNLDYNMSEEKICNKLRQISLIDKETYFESAVKRQEERVSSDVASNEEYIGTEKTLKSRCNPRTAIINNPYAYNDARMAFYKDPKDGEVWCFTSDTFTSLITSKINPYNGNPLPVKFVETIKAHVNILRELGVYDINRNIKDALKEIYERSVMNNVKTDYSYNTVVKCLSLFGVSESRFAGLKTITQEDTILRDICGVNIKKFDLLTPRQRIVTTARIIYSLSKANDADPNSIYQEIATAISGYENPVYAQNEPDYNQYINMLE